MKTNYLMVFCLGLLVGLIPFLMSCEMLKKYPQDNAIEEVIEYIIEKETAIDIDLTPFSPEKKSKITQYGFLK